MSLEAVRSGLLADADRRARQIVDEADAEARELVASARRQADAIIAKARVQGAAEGDLEAAREEAAERFTARLVVLNAQRESYDELCRRARDAAIAVRGEPAYRALLERLSAAARRDLGDGAEIETDATVGGVRARSGTRAVDYTLPALADRCLERLGARIAHLWT